MSWKTSPIRDHSKLEEISLDKVSAWILTFFFILTNFTNYKDSCLGNLQYHTATHIIYSTTVTYTWILAFPEMCWAEMKISLNLHHSQILLDNESNKWDRTSPIL